MMNKKENRMEMLAKAGVNTGKYFSFEIPDNIPAGSKAYLVFDESGIPQVKTEMKTAPMYNEIIEDGYVRNTRLFRRWTTAQMFRMLNYKSYDGREEGYNAALKRYAYHYTFEMMLEEVRVLEKLAARDRDSFNERSHFFTRDVIIKTCEDYLTKLKEFIDSKPTKNCKGVPYKRIKGQNIFVEDLPKKIYQPLQYKINRVKDAYSYTAIYEALQYFMKDMIRLPWNTPKSKDWIDAYKGNGAYYTCKNLIMFHDCRVHVSSHVLNREMSMLTLEGNLDGYQGEGWRMFAFMKKLIADNNFSFDKAMKEQYGDDYGKGRRW